MAAQDRAQNRFDAARSLIREQLQAMGDQDTLTVIGLNPQPAILLSGNAEQKTQVLLALDNLVPGATGQDLPAALTLANGLIDPTRLNQIIVLTDGAYAVEADALPSILAPLEWQIVPSNAPTLPSSNQALLNVSTRILPDGRHRLFARVINYSDAPVARTVQVFAGERLFDEAAVQLEPQTETARVWTLPATVETARVEIVEPDMLPLDNRAELWLLDTTRQRVLLVSDAPDTLARALEAQPGVEVTIDTPAARGYDSADFDLTVFEGQGLPVEMTAWPKGNILVVNPPLGHPLLPGPNFTRNLRPDPASASALLAGVDLSGVYFNRVLQVALPDWAETDLKASLASGGLSAGTGDTGQPLIFHGTAGDSRLVVWAFDLEASNLPARLALPLLMANTLQTLLSPAPQPVIPVGQPVLISGNFQVEVPNGRRLSSALESEGADEFFTHTKQPGLYKIYNQQDSLVAGFAVHAGSALESNLSPQFRFDVLNVERSTFNNLPPQIEYYEIWPWLAGLVLATVVFEGWLAWRK
jgi:hypothetical protein